MSARPENQGPSLQGTEGELVSIRIAVEPRLLEKLLDVLAGLTFPINPQLTHGRAGASDSPAGRETLVEFPAWGGRVREIERALAETGFERASLSVKGMLAEIYSAAARAA